MDYISEIDGETYSIQGPTGYNQWSVYREQFDRGDRPYNFFVRNIHGKTEAAARKAHESLLARKEGN